MYCPDIAEDRNQIRVERPDLLLEKLAPGVYGYTMEENDILYLPIIIARPEGQGNVGRYLDNLPRDRTVRVPCVISSRLQGMLERRGFSYRCWESEDGELLDGYERNGTKDAKSS